MPRTEVGRKVDRMGAFLNHPMHPRAGRTVRQRAKDQLGVSQWRIFGSDVPQFAASHSHTFSPTLMRRGERQIENGVFT